MSYFEGLQGDIPGKCSNFNYASRMAVKALRSDPVRIYVFLCVFTRENACTNSNYDDLKRIETTSNGKE